jgi:hypothetical protein
MVRRFPSRRIFERLVVVRKIHACDADLVRLGPNYRPSQGEINHPEIERVLQIDSSIDGRDHPAVGASAVGVECL